MTVFHQITFNIKNILFSLQIVGILATPQYCVHGSDAIKLIMNENTDYLSRKQHCRISLLYKQRMFETFSVLTDKIKPNLSSETKESYLLSWAYVLDKAPKTVLKNEANKVGFCYLMMLFPFLLVWISLDTCFATFLSLVIYKYI